MYVRCSLAKATFNQDSILQHNGLWLQLPLLKVRSEALTFRFYLDYKFQLLAVSLE